MAGGVQRDERKRTIDEVSKLEANLTPGQVQSGPAHCLDGIRHKGGVNLIQALVWNVATCDPDVKGETQGEDPCE